MHYDNVELKRYPGLADKVSSANFELGPSVYNDSHKWPLGQLISFPLMEQEKFAYPLGMDLGTRDEYF